MTRLQIRLFGPYFSFFSTNSYGYYSQTSQNLVSNFRIFASTRIVRQSPSLEKNKLHLILRMFRVYVNGEDEISHACTNVL
jgi:hypothetical protein